MKTLIKNITIIGLISLVFSGCSEDWLTLSNPNVMTSASYWKTEDQAVAGVNGIYQALTYDGTFLRFAPACLDSRDDITWSPSPLDAFSAVAQFNLLTTNYMPEAMYVGFYDIVKRSNAAIEKLPTATYTHPEVKDRLMGEALFLRGLSYSYLVTFWNHIPLILNTPQKADDYFNAPVDASVTWAQVIKDLTEAANLLPATYDAANKGRATKGAALAYLGKAYLFNKDYTNAAKIFKQIIDLNV